MSDSIEDVLEMARSKVASKTRQRDELNRDIAKWQRVVEVLSAVTEESSADAPTDILVRNPHGSVLFGDDYQPMNFTDGIRDVLRRANGVMTAPQIRDELKRMGFDLSKYKQELVPIHNTLKRLQDQQEVEAVKNLDGTNIGYKRINPILRAVEEEKSSWFFHLYDMAQETPPLEHSPQPRTRARGSVFEAAKKLEESALGMKIREQAWGKDFEDDKKKK